jgi:CHASE2 domain-containing sensor protein
MSPSYIALSVFQQRLEAKTKVTARDAIIWAPRAVGLALAIFLALFAVDAFADYRGILATVIALAMGLVPSLVVLAAVIVGWKHEAIAAGLFFALTGFYSVMALDHPMWIAIIAGPLLLVGILFLMSWRFQKGRPEATERKLA